MHVNDWRNRTIAELAVHLGPVAAFIVDKAISNIDDPLNGAFSPYAYIKFLRILVGELPDIVDGKVICEDLCRKVTGIDMKW